ncbi:hypothetical protein cypCar_00012924 [Cyprinus carpio]|nr:hypothetical protein cypCar_00012924 [Cyprinus carpio]
MDRWLWFVSSRRLFLFSVFSYERFIDYFDEMLVKGASRTCSDAEQTPRLLQVCRGTSPSDLYLHSYQEKCQKCAGQTLGKALRSGFDCEQCGVQLMFVVNAVFLLQANLPLLQRELLHCARAAKQTPAQYLSQHEHLLLSTSVPSPADSTELLLEPNESSRRHSPNRSKENGFHERPPASLEPPAKRICTISPAPRHSPAHPLQLPAHIHPTPPPLQHYALDDISTPHLYREPQRILELKERPRLTGSNGGYREEPVDHRLTEREWAEEWRHLDHESDRDELNYWRRRSNPHDDGRKNGSAAGNVPFSKTHSPLSAEGVNTDSQRDLPLRSGSGYVPDEIWRKAEEAVNEVKRQAMDEVQKAVAEAEQKAFEMITAERAKMEKTLAEAKRKATEDAIQVINEQEDSSECCWNCGRKASETCSGCNAARYCGSFCQHKDWERHHLICSPGLQTQPKSMPRIPAKAPESGPVLSPGLEKTSRASTPATPASSSSTPDASGH